jgi:hypothetical protein
MFTFSEKKRKEIKKNHQLQIIHLNRHMPHQQEKDIVSVPKTRWKDRFGYHMASHEPSKKKWMPLTC